MSSWTLLMVLFLAGQRLNGPERVVMPDPPATGFQNQCDQLEPGQICTFAGNPHFGHGVDPVVDSMKLKFTPTAHALDRTGAFIVDSEHRLIWYWNRSKTPVRRIGIEIKPRTIQIVAGSGGYPARHNSPIALETAIETPRDVVYDDQADRLYLAESAHNRIRYIDTNGFIFELPSANCLAPTSLALDSTRSILFAACSLQNKIMAIHFNTRTTELVAKISSPNQVAWNGGRIFVSQSNHPSILEFANGEWKEAFTLPTGMGKLRRFCFFKGQILALTTSNQILGTPVSYGMATHYGYLTAQDLTADPRDPGQLAFSDNAGYFGFYNPSDRIITQRIGAGKSQRFDLRFVTGLTYDSSTHELFIADAGHCRIRRSDSGGRLETVLSQGCGSPTVQNQIPEHDLLDLFSKESGLISNGLSMLRDGSLLIANTEANSIRFWNRDFFQATAYSQKSQPGKVSTLAGDFLSAGNDSSGPATDVRMNKPTYAVRDPKTGHILIVDSRNHCLREVQPNGNMAPFLGTCGQSGQVTNPTSKPQFKQPTSLEFDSMGNLIIADRGNNAVLFVNRSPNTVRVAQVEVKPGFTARIACREFGEITEETLAREAACASPTDLAIFQDNLCFSNQLAHNVRCFSLYGPRAGYIRTVAGHPLNHFRPGPPVGFEQEKIQATQATLHFPSALVFNEKGELFIADTYNHLVRKVRLK